MTKKKVILGNKKTAIMAVPKSLRRYILSVQIEMQKNVKGKKRKITILEAGIEVNRRLRK